MVQASDPTVSVVLSVHNGQPYLKEAVQSILDQTFEDFEFIIINDGSIDGTGEVLRELKQRDKRIHLVNQDNRGIPASRNRGLELARGKYIAVMDADDISHPERLARQVQFLETHPGIGILGTQVEMINADGEKTGEWRFPTDPDLVAWRLLFRTGLCHPTVMARRSLLEELGGYEEWATVAHDYGLFARAVPVTRLANLPSALLKYREHQESISKKKYGRLVDEVSFSARNLHQNILKTKPKSNIVKFLVLMNMGGIGIKKPTLLDEKNRNWESLLRYLKKLYKKYKKVVSKKRVTINARRQAIVMMDIISRERIKRDRVKNKKISHYVDKIRSRFMKPRREVLCWAYERMKSL
jgi:glycosyltransferase involved in cell wall biosynthesis